MSIVGSLDAIAVKVEAIAGIRKCYSVGVSADGNVEVQVTNDMKNMNPHVLASIMLSAYHKVNTDATLRLVEGACGNLYKRLTNVPPGRPAHGVN